MNNISINSKIYGVIGNPIEHSMSPFVHNFAIKQLVLDAYYFPFKIENLKNIDYAIKMFNISGLSVTLPHKEKIIKYLDEIDYISEKLGAVNTVYNKDGKLYGYNYDGSGAISALINFYYKDKNISVNIDYKSINNKVLNKLKDIRNSNILILGNGGAARGIALAMIHYYKFKNIFLAVRNISKGKKLYNEIKKYCNSEIVKIADLKDYTSKTKINIIINTTPVGMSPKIDFSPIDKRVIENVDIIYDIVYNPYNTLLIKTGIKLKKQVIRGVDMFVNQAALQFNLWTGKEFPVDKVRNKLIKILK